MISFYSKWAYSNFFYFIPGNIFAFLTSSTRWPYKGSVKVNSHFRQGFLSGFHTLLERTFFPLNLVMVLSINSILLFCVKLVYVKKKKTLARVYLLKITSFLKNSTHFPACLSGLLSFLKLSTNLFLLSPSFLILSAFLVTAIPVCCYL